MDGQAGHMDGSIPTVAIMPPPLVKVAQGPTWVLASEFLTAAKSRPMVP